MMKMMMTVAVTRQNGSPDVGQCPVPDLKSETRRIVPADGCAVRRRCR
jgi:hypothetical protein